MILELKVVGPGNEGVTTRFWMRLVRKWGSDILFPLLPKEDVRVPVVVLRVAREENAEAKTRRSLPRPPCRPRSLPRSDLRQRLIGPPPRPRSHSPRPRVGRSPRVWSVPAGLVGPTRAVVVQAFLVATTSRLGARHAEQKQGVAGVEYLFARAARRDVAEGGDAGERVVCEVRAVFGAEGWRQKKSRVVGRQSLDFVGPVCLMEGHGHEI